MEACLNIQLLRQQTEADHRAVEDALPLMQTGLNQTKYVACLARLYGVIAAWDEYTPAYAPEWLRLSILSRNRRLMLEDDLACFGVTAPGDRATLPPMSDLAGLLGAMYVMEGSTLGGQIIARHVRTVLPLTEDHGSAFFRGHGAQTGPLWKDFCEMLKDHVPDDQTATVIASAKAMFATFGQWMEQGSIPHDH